MNHAPRMVAMLVSDDNGPGSAQRFFDPLRLFREIWLHGAAAEKFVDLFVHARVDHDVTVGVDDLENRPSLDAWDRRRALDGKVFGAAAFGEFQDIDPQRPPARN